MRPFWALHFYTVYVTLSRKENRMREGGAMADQAISLWQYYQTDYPLNIMVVGKTACTPDYHVARECSHIMALEYISQGKGTFEINGQTYQPERNSTMLLTKGSRHMYEVDPTHLWHKQWIVFDGPYMEQLIRLYLPKDTYYFPDCNLLPYFDEIDRLMELHRQDYRKLVDNVAIVLLSIVLLIKNQTDRIQYEIAEQVRQILDMQIENKLSLTQLADQLNYSKNYLIKVFKEKYGITPYQYFMERKIHIAKLYLSNTNYSVTAISGLLSFTDEHYFSNYFHTAAGMSPSRYRKEMQLQNGGETPSLMK